jgi:hypothetical protein
MGEVIHVKDVSKNPDWQLSQFDADKTATMRHIMFLSPDAISSFAPDC